MIIYREIIAGARQPNVLQMTAVVTENVTGGVTHFVTGGVTLLVTYDVTFSDTMKPGSTNCNSISCERDHLESVTLGVTDGVTLDVTLLVTGDVTLCVTTKKEKNKRKKKFPLHPLKKKKNKKKKKTHSHPRACARKFRQKVTSHGSNSDASASSMPSSHSPRATVRR